MLKCQRNTVGLLGGAEGNILEWFDQFGAAALGLLSFSEAIIQPIPPDLMYLPQLINAEGKVGVIVWLWFIITISSVLGSLVGYWIGQRWGRTLLDRFASRTSVLKLETLTERYGRFGVFVAAVSPIPYKVFGWVAGMGEMDKKDFVLAGLIGRGLRFGIEALMIGIYGDRFLAVLEKMLDNEFLIALVMIVIIAALIPLVRWWNGLEPSTSEE